MNTRILRMCDRPPLKSHWTMRRVRDLGQMQPVLFAFEGERGLTLRIEGVAQGRACWQVLPLPRYKAQAKAAFAELEAHKADGTDTPARAVWRAYETTRPTRAFHVAS